MAFFSCMDKVFVYPMTINMKELGKMAKNMDTVSFVFPTETSTKETLRMVNDMDMVFSFCPTVISMKAIGEMIKDMEKVFIKVKNLTLKVSTLMI